MTEITFKDLALSPSTLKAIEEIGYVKPSPIQAEAIPVVLAGKDIIGQAQTGTGKTAAFMLPILEKIDPKNKNVQALVLCPTRELAVQVHEESKKFSRNNRDVHILSIYGGQSYDPQIRALKKGVQIVVGTPGRVMDHMRRGTLKLENLKMLVLDEADEMLNMGFREDIETILQQIPTKHQTLLFSATMAKPIMDIAKTYLTEPEIVKVVKKELTVPKIDQYYYEVNPRKKNEVLSRLLDLYDPELSLVFCNTKRKVDELVEDLKGRGYFAEGLHGDMKQSQRDRVMNGFRNGKTDILVATDVAARGIDVDDVEAVFNYDVPQDDEYYVHRIGRTGRAGRSGRAFTLVVGREIYKLKDIMRYCKTKIKRQPIPSVDDITEIKAEKILEKASSYIDHGNLPEMMDILEEHLDDKEYSALEMAAAFLMMELGEIQNPELRQDDFGDTGAEPGMVRLFINIGKKQRVRIGDILGAIAGESGMEGKLVGAIDMFDSYTFVEVPREYASEVIEAMKHAKIKGKNVNVEPANRK